MKFHSNSCNSFQPTERTGNSFANDQREITQKIRKDEVWFLHMTHILIVFYNCMKFHSNGLNSFHLTEWTRNCIYQCSKGNNLKNIKARVMVLVHDTSSQFALQIYEVLSKYL